MTLPVRGLDGTGESGLLSEHSDIILTTVLHGIIKVCFVY